MVSTLDGEEIFSCTNRRYSSTVLPAFDPIDIAINSVISLIHLRDISLARTEYEVGREIVLRLPTAQRNISELQTVAQGGTRNLDSSSSRASLPVALLNTISIASLLKYRCLEAKASAIAAPTSGRSVSIGARFS